MCLTLRKLTETSALTAEPPVNSDIVSKQYSTNAACGHKSRKLAWWVKVNTATLPLLGARVHCSQLRSCSSEKKGLKQTSVVSFPELNENNSNNNSSSSTIAAAIQRRV